ncbi:MAG: glycosyltransferase [Acidobacteria bacterium]|nr:glycosyltransferase [Acidobacteriota bacterium]
MSALTGTLPSARRSVATPRYRHLERLTDGTGVFEHALHAEARPEHGYCLDDVARALLVVVREPDQDDRLGALAETYLRFVEAAVTDDGRAHNRRAVGGAWTDEAGTGDWWGRAVWASGIAAGAAPTPLLRRRALRVFTRAARRQSRHLHASAFAALGAAAVLRLHPEQDDARRIVRRLIGMVPPPRDAAWLWPETRMTYGSGSIAEALLSAGVAVGDAAATARGLELVGFVLDRETRDGRLSVTGTAGRGAEDHGLMFDQQPIEVAAIADACAAAFEVTGASGWLDGIRLAWAWFEGDNDSRTPMVDHASGAGYDGLEIDGRNENRGAESTLAALSTWQLARRYAGMEVAS